VGRTVPELSITGFDEYVHVLPWPHSIACRHRAGASFSGIVRDYCAEATRPIVVTSCGAQPNLLADHGAYR